MMSRPRDTDAATRIRFLRMVPSLGPDFTVRDTSDQEDYDSVGDVWLGINGKGEVPVGMKCRGKNSGNDHPLSAWSLTNGRLKEFSTAGNQLYFYEMLHEYRLVLHGSQELLERKYWPPHGYFDPDGPDFQWMLRPRAGVRRSSNCSDVPQGVVYVEEQDVEVWARWDKNTEKLIEKFGQPVP